MRLEQPLRIGRSRHRSERGTVDRVAAIAWQRDTADRFDGGRARLGELPGDAGEVDHIASARCSKHCAHAQQQIVGDAYFFCVEFAEALAAVATLDDEAVSRRDA